ncbi:MAG: imidazole glycerol phosphate synthase subunit HisH [Candidatus Geothermarchaeales archaeon]
MPRICILDCGVGNVFSLKTSLERVSRRRVEIVSPQQGFEDFNALVLPGVGHFSATSKTLRRLRVPIDEYLEGGGYLLGVCLGAQLLAERSEEGLAEGMDEGLGLIRGEVVRLPESVKIPHIGWNTVKISRSHRILEGIDDDSYFYFAHSYYLEPQDPKIVYGTTRYGVTFPSVIVEGSVVGTQFHPEKSGKNGLKFLKNFVEELR